MGLMVSSTLGKPLYSCHFQMQLLPRLFSHQQKTLLPVHADLYALNTFSITGLSFFLSFFLFLMLFLLFCLFLFFSLERWRSQSQVIIKIKAQQIQQTALQTKYWNSNFSDWLTHEVHTTTMTPVDLPWRCDWSEVFTHSLDNSSSPDPEAHTDANTSIEQQPDGSGCFLHYGTLLVDKPECDEGTDGIAGETETCHLSHKNAQSCLERSLLFSARFFFIMGAVALLWLDPTGNTVSHLEKVQQDTLIVLLFQLSLLHW